MYHVHKVLLATPHVPLANFMSRERNLKCYPLLMLSLWDMIGGSNQQLLFKIVVKKLQNHSSTASELKTL